MEVGSVGLARLDVLSLELRSQLADLRIAKRHHLVLTISTGWGLLSCAPGTLGATLELAEDRLPIELGWCGIQ